MRKSSKMYPIVERWKKSGLTKKNFCKQEEIPLTVMRMIVMMGCDYLLGKSWRVVETKAPLVC